MRLITTIVVCVLLTCTASAASPPASVDQVLAGAQAQAASQHKLVFFVFGASWCGPCHALDRFLSAPDIRTIIEKYFVLAEVHIQEEMGKHPELNTPGADKLAAKLGDSEGIPFLVVFDAAGAPIVNSNRPLKGGGSANIGYPDTPEEIDWFMAMLKKSVPGMSAADVQTIETWLRKASQTK
jgi:thiol-disulfide isomerase/thioredoxin